MLFVASIGGVELDVVVRNSGVRSGREVVQVYVEPGPGADDPDRPLRWLGGFAVADVAPGATATVSVRVPARALQTWDPTARRWRPGSGRHRLRVGRSIRDLRLVVDEPPDDPLAPLPTRTATHNKETP